MNYRFMVTLLVAAAPCVALGQASTAYKCSYGDLQRRVEILTEPGVPVPCEVHYYKDTEAPGERQVLWSASSEAGYCEKKTEEFVTKLQGWGWSCATGEAAAPTAPAAAPEPTAAPEAPTEPEPAAAPAAPVDDTEDLAPVD